MLTEAETVGWRIAYLVLRDKIIDKLERHPGTYESFEPVRGKTVLYVADREDETAVRAFHLTRPVILNKGIWHGVVTLGDESEIKITENAYVRTVFWKTSGSLDPYGTYALSRT